jgi:hypothetical protein
MAWVIDHAAKVCPRKTLGRQIIDESWPTGRHPCTRTKSAGSRLYNQMKADEAPAASLMGV